MFIINIMKSNYGCLNIILGPMFSGKTTKLMETYHYYKTRNDKKCIILGHSIDNRYDKYKITTHEKKEFLDCCKCVSIEEFIKNYLGEINSCYVILIDECQFFEDIEKVLLLVELGKHVYLYGLDGDAKQNLFGSTYKLLPYCDSIEKLNGTCYKCGIENGAIFSICNKDFNKVNQIHVGGEDSYHSVCRNCC